MAMRFGLRTDERQWLIYDDETIGAVMRGLEAFALHVAGGPLTKHRVLGVRAIGTVMRRVAELRLAEMERNDGAQRQVVHHIRTLFRWLGTEQRGLLTPEPPEVDELYAAVFRLDSRLQGAGTTGPGTHRIAGRGD